MPAPAPRRVDESMSLLADVLSGTLDPAYAEAAARSGAGPGRPHRRWGVLPTTVALVVIGLLVAVGAVQVRRHAPAAAQEQARLRAQVSAASAQAASLQHRIDTLSAAISAQRAGLLRETALGSALAAQLHALQQAAAALPLTGAGLQVQLSDAPTNGPADPLGSGGSSPAPNRILDRDLQQVVNALWAAGARGIAINGERLSTLSAIREAGSAILVDFRPISSPYTILAVGSPVAMETAFGSSRTAAQFRTYQSVYGLGFHYSRVRTVTLPAASGLALHLATPAPGSAS